MLGFNPHCHILVTDGCFYGNKGMFRTSPLLELKKLEAIFRHKVLRMLLNKGKITKEFIAMLSTWRHSGFNVFCGNRISPTDDTAMENLARYIIRAILEHLGLWLTRASPPPKAHAQCGHYAASSPHECAACDLQLQTHADTIYGDPEYSWDAYIHA